jgi:trigger factor
VKVGQNELTSYVVQASQQYGMEPGEFVKILDQNGQLPGVIGEIARSKALATVLSKAKVVDTKGRDVDVSDFLARALGDGDSGEAFEIDEHDDHDGHDHASPTGKDSHGRKPGNEHYGHDHS